MHHEILPATQDHINALKGRLRKSDVDEIGASCGLSPDVALQLSFQTSEVAWAGLAFGGDVVAIFGVVRRGMFSTTGIPWMLGTDGLAPVWIEVGRRTKHYVHEMKARFDLLENHVDARQKASIRWLKWCGFTLEPAKPWGVLGLPFHRFSME